MDKYELSKDWIRKNTTKIKKAYLFAVARKFDIKSKGNILDILKASDPLNANDNNAKVFSEILQLFSQELKKRFESKQKTKLKIIN